MLRFQIFIAAVLLLSQSSRSADPIPVVVGYLPEYRVEKIDAAQLSGISHLIYFGITAPADGQLAAEPVSKSTLSKLRAIQKQTGCKLLICVGGWGRSDGFRSMTADAAAQTRFISQLTKYCADHDFAGIDYDWEHPKDEAELSAYAKLISETKRLGQRWKLEVSVAQAGWQNIGQAAYNSVDRIHLMAYDHDFPQSTTEKATADVQRLIEWKCPPGKIALGVPFYGRNKAGRSKTYAEITTGKSPDKTTNVQDGYAFNGIDLILKKREFARRMGLAGMMIWELGQDSPAPEQSLLRAIVREQ